MGMDKVEKISIESIGVKTSRQKVITLTNNEAVLTHYLHNTSNCVSQFYRRDALRYTEELLAERFPEKTVAPKLIEKQIKNVFKTKSIPFPPTKNSEFKFIDLFAGIGGSRLALQSVGRKCIYSSEFEPNAKRTHFENFGEVPFGDITEEEPKNYIPDNFDILCGGFPCQAFSIAGNRKGFSDTRGTP